MLGIAPRAVVRFSAAENPLKYKIGGAFINAPSMPSEAIAKSIDQKHGHQFVRSRDDASKIVGVECFRAPLAIGDKPIANCYFNYASHKIHQRRYLHTSSLNREQGDWQKWPPVPTSKSMVFPNNDAYRRPEGRDPYKRNENGQPVPFYQIAVTVGLGAAFFEVKSAAGILKGLAPQFIDYHQANIEIPLEKIPAGKTGKFVWRGKIMFVKHRTEAQIAQDKKVEEKGGGYASFRDPQPLDQRCLFDEKWLVMVGICTHLGCIPIPDKGNYSGYFCPCHGSHYDGLGRIRQGPAPRNLDVPVYTLDEEKITIMDLKPR